MKIYIEFVKLKVKIGESTYVGSAPNKKAGKMQAAREALRQMYQIETENQLMPVDVQAIAERFGVEMTPTGFVLSPALQSVKKNLSFSS